MLYSQAYEVYAGSLPGPVLEAISEIEEFFGIDKARILSYDEGQIAIPISFSVSLPTRGPVNGIDIREAEPALVRINISRYPSIAPVIMSDRKDFPKSKLSHLYITSRETEPTKLCLVRNNPNEWFADKRIADLLAVGESWFFKAGSGILTEDGNEFDPLLIEDAEGNHIYEYKSLIEVVTNNQRLLPDHPFAVLLSHVFSNGYHQRRGLTFKTISSLPFISIPTVREAIKKILAKAFEEDITKPLLSLLVWDEDLAIETDYYTSLPADYSSLKEFFGERNINIDGILKSFHSEGLQILRALPIIYAIKRPRKIIGVDGDIEFINFVLVREEDGKLNDRSKVYPQMHIEPFSKGLAERISGEQRNKKIIYIGAGSLGSKMIIHDARAGNLEIGICDGDRFLEHNMARHSLFADKLGMNKAEALKEIIDNINETDITKKYVAYPYDSFYMNRDDIDSFDWIIDSTASQATLQDLVRKELPGSINLARCEIAHEGKLGLLYIEGNGRNPRLDDLVCFTFYRGLTNSAIESWRRFDNRSVKRNLDIGLGCSSTTNILPDNLISLHAAAFSKIFYQELHREKTNGKGLIYTIQGDTDAMLSIKTGFEIIDPFVALECNEGSGWLLRFAPGICEQMLKLCREKEKIETGGVLIGRSNYKTKTIHVLDIITEPQDSRGSCAGFTRGIKGLPEQVNHIKEKTGETIGYVGEWHTHPMDLEGLSGIDRNTIGELREINQRTPIPTCAVIVTNDKILPFVFE